MKKTSHSSNAALRQKARAKLCKESDRLRALSEQDTRHLITELGTHQIELEMQNEELSRALQELEAVSGRYKDLYDFAPVGYLTLDSHKIISEANQTAAELLGLGKRTLLGKPFLGFFADENAGWRVFNQHQRDVIMKQTRQTCELMLKTKQGQVFHAQLQSIAADSLMEKKDSVRIAITDISELKRALEGLSRELVTREKLEKELKQANAELEAVNKELEAFSFAVASDLKTPLRSIEGFSRALLEDFADKLDETGQNYCKRVQAATVRMTQLIDALWTMARLTSGELKEQVVDLSGLAQAAAVELKTQESDRQVEFLIAEGVKVKGDSDMLRMVIENLFENAWKFTAKHGSAKIEFGAAKIAGGEAYWVRDDGAGFTLEFADKLFQPFHRMHTSAEFPGIGIGLAIAYNIIKRHGGRMWAESEVEKGATFYFTL